MASPQPDKFTRFSNELLEAYISIVRLLSPYENSVWLCVFRKTYGYGQKEDWISLSQIEIMTGIRQPHVARSKKKLLLKNMIAKRNGGIGVQKDYDLWNIPKQVYLNRYNIPKQVLPKQVINVTQTGNFDLPKQVDTKETINKYTKEIELVFKSWNERMPWKVREISGSRLTHLKERLKEKQFIDEFHTILTNILESDFLSGRKTSKDHPNFRADFDFVVKNETNYIKILEGKYANAREKEVAV